MATPTSQISVEDDEALDSVYDDDDNLSETFTLQSKFREYVYQNGRRYNSYQAGKYWGPNDDTHQESLDISHHLFRLTLDGELFMSPIGPNPQRVLDLGTGTGIWAIEFADQYPCASVIGTDLSPIQPELVPPNVQFEVDDFELEWTYTKESFDFIHARAIYGAVSDYPALYKRVMDHLKPGGWFEATEVGVVPMSDDDTIQGTTLAEWGDLSLSAGDKFGRSLRIVDQTYAFMEAAGFVNITYQTFKWPMGPWPKDRKLKEIGMLNRINWEEGMEGWLMFLFTTYHGWSPERVRLFIAETRKLFRCKDVHSYQMISVCCGQKPPNS